LVLLGISILQTFIHKGGSHFAMILINGCFNIAFFYEMPFVVNNTQILTVDFLQAILKVYFHQFHPFPMLDGIPWILENIRISNFRA
jgi:hypothetical protein